MFKKFFNQFVEVDGRVGSYMEHVLTWFICGTLALLVLKFLALFLSMGSIGILFILSLLVSIGTYKADKRLNGATTTDEA